MTYNTCYGWVCLTLLSPFILFLPHEEPSLACSWYTSPLKLQVYNGWKIKVTGEFKLNDIPAYYNPLRFKDSGWLLHKMYTVFGILNVKLFSWNPMEYFRCLTKANCHLLTVITIHTVLHFYFAGFNFCGFCGWYLIQENMFQHKKTTKIKNRKKCTPLNIIKRGF